MTAPKRFEELTPEELGDRMKVIGSEMATLLESKRASYGPGPIARFGMQVAMINAEGKICRIETMLNTGTYVNKDGDSFEDAWLDLIGYGMLGLLYYRLNAKTQDTLHGWALRGKEPPYDPLE